MAATTQTAPAGSFTSAQAGHRIRLARIESVIAELEQIAEQLSDQV